MTDGPSPPDAPRRREPDPFLGGTMMAVGGLMAALCGGCTLMVIGAARNSSPNLLIGLLLGGVPTLFGVLLFRAGLRTFRGGPR